jgi:hypothetical protein
MVVFALVAMGVLATRCWGLRRSLNRVLVARIVLISGLAVSSALVLSLIRDRSLSGWWLYPLSVLPFDVPWRAPDPDELRQATLGYHRNPEDIWGSLQGWHWVISWVGRLPTQWETWLLVVLGSSAVVALVAARVRGALGWRAFIACLAPSAAASAVWFVAAPPSFRFAWGPLMTLGAIGLGWSLWSLRVRWLQALAAGILALVALVSLVSRTEWSTMTEARDWKLIVSIPYAVTPLPNVPVEVVPASEGLEVLVPKEGEQCWGVYPLCTPRVDPLLTLAGRSLAEGLLLKDS